MPVALEKKILIIDDDEAVLAGLRELFRSKGYNVEVAKSGFAGGMLVEKHRPDIIILDLVMAGFDGFWLGEYLKKTKYLKHIKVVVLTGYPTEDNISKAKRFGAMRIFSKPVDTDVLIKEVASLIGNS